MKKSADVGNYAVLFVDILGQSKKLLQYSAVPAVRTADFDRWLHETVGLAWYVQETLAREIAKLNRSQSIVGFLFGQKNINKIRTNYISDSIILHTEVFSLDGEIRAAAADIFKMLLSTCNLFLSLMSNGVFFRAALDVGIGVEDESGKLYGPAVMKAYNLESTIADYPRIVLGSTVVEFLHESISQPVEFFPVNLRPKIQLEIDYAKRILSVLIPITEHEFMVDILSDEFLRFFDTNTIQESLRNAYMTIEKKIEEFKLEPKILSKYVLLREYFNSYWKGI